MTLLLSMMFLIGWQSNSDKYREPFTKTMEANYVGSDLKGHVDRLTNRARTEQPILTSVLPVAYAVGVRKEVRVTSKKISPIPGTVATYQYNDKTKSGSIAVTWRF